MGEKKSTGYGLKVQRERLIPRSLNVKYTRTDGIFTDLDGCLVKQGEY